MLLAGLNTAKNPVKLNCLVKKNNNIYIYNKFVVEQDIISLFILKNHHCTHRHCALCASSYMHDIKKPTVIYYALCITVLARNNSTVDQHL